MNRALRVAVEATALAGERSGVGKYLGHLLAHWPADGAQPVLIAGRGVTPWSRRRTRQALQAPAGGPPREVVVPFFPHGPRRLTAAWYERVAYPRLLARLGTQLYFAPNYFLPPVLPAGLPGVITVHDLTFLRHPEQVAAPLRQRLARDLKDSCDRAAGIITVSRATRADLIELLGVPGEKIMAIHEGATVPPATTPAEEERVMKKRGILEPYILFLGNIESRKNLVRLVRAFYQFAEPIQLVLAGSRAWQYPELQRELKGKNVVLTGYLTDHEAAALLRRALFLAYPSLYEGFGLVPLEAMSVGCPVLAGRSGALPEVLGDAVEWIDPHSTDDIVRGLEKLWYDDAWRDTLAARGREQAARYRWPDAAAATVAYFRDLVQI